MAFPTALQKLAFASTNMRIDGGHRSMKAFIQQLPHLLRQGGHTISKARNEIRVREIDGEKIVTKSFDKIHPINRFVYCWLRPSKARRSFENGYRLLDRGVDTPHPVACLDRYSTGILRKSIYVYVYRPAKMGLQQVLGSKERFEREKILREFARFAGLLNQRRVYHKDFSPGNILIEKRGAHYHFILVDINRMRFGHIAVGKWHKVLSRIRTDEDTLRLLAEEYVRCLGKDTSRGVRKVIRENKKFHRRRKMRKKLKKFFQVR